MIRKVFAFVLLLISATCLFAAVFRFNRGDDFLAQGVVPFTHPDVPTEYQRKITYPLQKFDPHTETKTVDGAAMYVRDYRDSWIECLSHFNENTDWGRNGSPTWTDPNFPHHTQFPSNFLAQPSVRGWRDCQTQLHKALTGESAEVLRLQVREGLERSKLQSVAAYGIVALMMSALAFQLYRSSREETTEP